MPSEPLQSHSVRATRPFSIAIAALGGQGGGVLAEWLVAAAELNGWIAQSTSVPGVAQRTGTTVYYIEMSPAPRAHERRPVFALMPVPGDVDLVVAAELMEAGRTVVRGLVTPERTTVVSSSHRVYGITEKSALGDAIADSNAVMAALNATARRLICFDMEALADENKSVVSSVLFGAIAASGALPFSQSSPLSQSSPFPQSSYEQAIRDGGVAVKTNLAGFAAGFAKARRRSSSQVPAPAPTQPTTDLGHALDERIKREFPVHLHGLIQEGVKRMLDYQDEAYASFYLGRLQEIRDCDRKVAASADHALTGAVARYLALWMSYEDTIRVADLKTRSKRFSRVRTEVHAASDQIVYLTEFMHPRFEEVCETLPAGLGRWLLDSSTARKMLAPLFRKGRRIRTAHLSGFLVLYAVAGMRRWRRGTLRYRIEQDRIDEWLTCMRGMVSKPGGYDCALEVAECQRLIKGYSDTHERGLKNYRAVMQAVQRFEARPDRAETIRRLRNAALADEEGNHLQAVLSDLEADPPPQAATA